MPFFPLPGWEERAKNEAITGWSKSRETLLAGAEPHALLMAERDDSECGRLFEDIDDGLLGFAELGLLPAPPEKEIEDLGEIAGEGLEATATPSKATPKLYPYLANLAVRASARRLGLGKELVAAIEGEASQFGFDRMYIKVERSNIAARRLYDQLGYRLVYLKPAGWTPKDGPTDSSLFLRKDGLAR